MATTPEQVAVQADPDASIDVVVPAARALVRAVGDRDGEKIAEALGGLTGDGLRALVLLLADEVSTTSELRRPPLSATAAAILAETARRFRVHPDVLVSQDRRREPTVARQVGMAAARLAGLASTDIGGAFHRDHSTVLYAASRVGEDARLQRIAREIAEPYRIRGVLGDAPEDHGSRARFLEAVSA
ncbi:helix-turn-helix domain-containing protein [Nocardioides sp. R-C-SC26]|uniref:helix-turn-helix domain-containing protein n=1 Tax=Nocardioides sp. R-C-SC26 TaxID=2870414 RepID=UPI001E50754E|nr:helix-turn-helix domain-containing protein [Nocardioides sp. R-C-SC26]